MSKLNSMFCDCEHVKEEHEASYPEYRSRGNVFCRACAKNITLASKAWHDKIDNLKYMERLYEESHR